jgi:hypothetical protein
LEQRGWRVGAGEEKSDGALGGFIFSNWRRERGGWGSTWRGQVEEKMRGASFGRGTEIRNNFSYWNLFLPEAAAGRVTWREHGRWMGGSGLMGWLAWDSLRGIVTLCNY